MRQQMRSVLIIVIAALFVTVAPSERHVRADSVQNYKGVVQGFNETAKSGRSFPRPNWMLKYVSGSLSLKPDQWLRMAFVSRSALEHISATISVPADELVTVEYNPKVEKDSELLQGPRSGCSYARSMMPDASEGRPELVVAIPTSPGHLSRWAERLRPKHPVRFVWVEEDQQKSMVVKVNDCEYQSFMANVRWLAGDRWQEIGHESKQ
jgi:hypothetical protein